MSQSEACLVSSMSLEMHQFLNDSGGNFTETAPRPPVPGEENELQSNGGNSTRSSGSYKSHTSAKSSSSNVAHSPAATPRRSNLDRTNMSSMSLSDSKLLADDDVDKFLAPLGFEPEGSVASSPAFHENSTPPYLKWAESFQHLLEDGDGVKLFKQFCDLEQCTVSFEFLFACKGIKLAEADRVLRTAKVIYGKLIKPDKLNIHPDTKKKIYQRLKKNQADASIFEAAEAEVLSVLQGDVYKNFLKSDIYMQYVQAGGESPKTANSSGSNSARPLSSGLLPTLHEGEELSQDDIQRTAEPTSLTLTSEALMFTHKQRTSSEWNNFRKPDGIFPPGSSAAGSKGSSGSRVVNPYHVSYAPVSAQDSELQSLSSDAHTDDTMSLTDSSVDGRDMQKRKHIRRNAKANRHVDMAGQPFIPRTDRLPVGSDLAEKEPKKFAALLIERLQLVKDEIDKEEKMRKSLHTIEKEEAANKTIHTLFASAIADKENDNGESILEEHMSRVFGSSNVQTPSRSPGRHSPTFTGLHPVRQAPFPTPNTSSSLLLPSGRKGKHKDANVSLQNSSMDSDMGVEERTGVYYEGEMPTHKHIYHYHHHHHHVNQNKGSSSTSRLANEKGNTWSMKKETATGTSQYSTDGSDPSSHRRSHNSSSSLSTHKVSDSSKKLINSSTRSGSLDRSGHIMNSSTRSGSLDRSGHQDYPGSSSVGMAASYGVPGHLPIANLPSQDSYMPPQTHPTTSSRKVSAWLMTNETVATGTSQYSTDGSDPSSHKRSHKSASSASTHKGATSSNKKQMNSSRSGSLDRSHQDYPSSSSMSASYGAPGVLPPGPLPSQPISQDHLMPLLSRPNTTVQLEEAKRRLEDERASRHMLKSKSFTGGVSLKDKRAMPPPSHTPRSSKNIPQVAPLDLSSSEEYSSSSQKSEKRSRKPAFGSSGTSSHSLPTTPSTHPSQVSTTVAYYLDDDIPYVSTIRGEQITLLQFKQLFNKRGTFRYYFKKVDNEFDSGCVHEEFFDDSAVLPLWEGKVICKVVKVEKIE